MKRIAILFVYTAYAFGAVQYGDSGLLALMWGSFGAGLLLSFTPCVLPMVPIVSSIVVGAGKSASNVRAFMLSSAYVAGTTATYTAMGALAGATGEQLQAYFQSAWAIGIFAAIFFVMSLSMFGFFEIQLPAFLQSKLDARARSIEGGSFLGSFLLGAVSALILGACVSPILISFLGVAIAKADAWLGAATMFALALGMGVPLILVGTGAGYLVPKAGMWTVHIKHLFGTVLLATAIYILTLLDSVEPLWLWGMFAVGIAVFLRAFEPLEADADKWAYLRKSVAVIAFVTGVLWMAGAAYGSRSLTKPLAAAMKSMTLVSEENYVPFRNVNDMEELEKALAKAKAEQKPVVVYFFKRTCPVCKKLEATTFQDPKVRAALKKDFVALKVDITDPADEERQAIRKRFKIFGSPSFLFFDSDGEYLPDETFYGYQDAESFYTVLDMMAY